MYGREKGLNSQINQHSIKSSKNSEKRKINKEDMDTGFETFLENRKISVSSNISTMYT